ncbi:heavy metal-(Cd/Co/Hg/Pb/Zn)-translocating P-type ATPase [Saccharopolyspora erythraea NRRL 2338]|uniref:Cation-transporting P-type ATPase D n=2 Tax=Saccharopolyspora erythraea TaxID=1836 RepID=A4FL83_SACEN|nr:heavy metal translocating P-type ATPase [Saccharopolyspora erythraea]EQD85216.1 cation-transporting ATPase [Saccharopolyspora erythraea D]PFG98448.1 heavy metal-(Cd/Co/Hg/Pb/Zn)-translocating P-type ATPase [Saccharopolyspora erythraea NRRL 2338]QRK88514.1 cadmium-translocating P-type ATPase [Saccharopolyspora erythraea]CAM04808.1 putative cation-transporting P-type ATPase D [Saccharopolyspora erythraea NRRL 2338]
MRALTEPTSAPTTRTPAPARRSLLALPEARWAAGSLLAFLLGLGTELAGGPTWLAWTLYLVCYATGGWEPALEGLRALRERTLDVDLLMIVAAIGAASIGQVTDGGLLIVIFATSGALEAYATARTEDSVRGLLDLAPDTAVRVADGVEETVPAAELRVGDVIVVRPGERLGADGVVVEGASDVDQSTITGESLPVSRTTGDEVFAGTLNGSGALRVRVGRDASETVIARIVEMVSEASRTQAPTQLFIEKVEQRYSVGVVVATLAVFAVPMLFGDGLESALLRAMTFMIVASPCAVVLATMPPLLSAIANAGRHGVLVKSAVAMERLAEVRRVALDKTGTLTEGRPRITEVRGAPGHDADEVLALAAGAEHLSEHPLAHAIVAAARERGLDVPRADEFQAVAGHGVSATVGGRRVEVTRPASDGGSAAGTVVVVTVDGVAAAELEISDRLRPDAAAAVRALREVTGTEPVLLTGDGERAAARVADEVGITDVRARLLPQDKVEAVRSSGEPTMVVGDGVNDAPALAAAHSGVAMGRAGADLTLETADVVVVRDELSAVPAVIDLSRRARRLVKQNLVIAGTFITVLVVWDLAGHLPLPLGVAGHEGSTVIVGLNGLRLLRRGAWSAGR